MKIIIGLGNPDKKYDRTRHNLGFAIVDELAKRAGKEWQLNKKFNAEIVKTPDFFLVKPQTYMNNSGETVRKIADYYDMLNLDNEDQVESDTDLSTALIVIHDELDIVLGKYKISINSSSAGHRGVQSIIDHLKTKNFTRIRAGIATDILDKVPSEEFVLKRFNKEEQKIIDTLIPEILVNL